MGTAGARSQRRDSSPAPAAGEPGPRERDLASSAAAETQDFLRILDALLELGFLVVAGGGGAVGAGGGLEGLEGLAALRQRQERGEVARPRLRVCLPEPALEVAERAREAGDDLELHRHARAALL